MRSIRIFTLFVTLSLIAFNAMSQTIEQQKTDSVFQQVKKVFQQSPGRFYL